MDITKIIRLLKKEIGPSKAVVQHRDPFKVLIATVLSQRTRDENTAKASAQLFKKYGTVTKLSKSPLKEVEKLIKPSGFYKVKAKRIKEISKQLLENFGGKTPRKLEELISLVGVGRKTANCVLVYGFGMAALPVDTHVHRISNRIGLVKTTKPDDTEMKLLKVIPKRYWIEINDLMVKHGQRKCFPRNPNCRECLLINDCKYGKRWKKSN